MNRQAEVIVIGGGIVGCSILYHLAKIGVKDAVLLERNELTSGATWHAAGNVHTQSAYANLSALQAYSLRLYDGLAEEVGQEVGSHVVGGFFLAQSQERMREFSFLAGKFRALGLEYELVTPAEIVAKHPLINPDGLVGGAWDPEEGYVDPYSVTMGLAAGARQMGARIERGKRVEAIRRDGNEWVLTVGDETWRCDKLVNCGGFWANDVANMIGARLPIMLATSLAQKPPQLTSLSHRQVSSPTVSTHSLPSRRIASTRLPRSIRAPIWRAPAASPMVTE